MEEKLRIERLGGGGGIHKNFVYTYAKVLIYMLCVACKVLIQLVSQWRSDRSFLSKSSFVEEMIKMGWKDDHNDARVTTSKRAAITIPTI